MSTHRGLSNELHYKEIVIRTLENQVIDYKKRIIELEKILDMSEEEIQEFRTWLKEKKSMK
jgi:hypothetical protein